MSLLPSDDPVISLPPAGTALWEVAFTFHGHDYVEEAEAPDREAALRVVCDRLATRFNRRSFDLKTMAKVDDIMAEVEESAEVVMLKKAYDRSMNETMTRHDVITEAKELIGTVVKQFYPSNSSAYRRLQIDMEDIEQHLWVKVMRTHVTTVEKIPNYYRNRQCFRKALYIALKNECLAHYRMHVKSECRGAILKAQVIELDNPDMQAVSLSGGENDEDYLRRVKTILDRCDDELLTRMLFYVAYDRVDNKAELRKILGLPKVMFGAAWTRMVEYMDQHRDELRRAAAEHHDHVRVVNLSSGFNNQSADHHYRSHDVEMKH